MAARTGRAAVQALRDVASREGWTVAGTFIEGAGPSAPEYKRVRRGITSNEFDLVAVPSLSALGGDISEVLAEILRIRDAGCDLYVHDRKLNTASPVDRTLFPIAEALKAVDDATRKQPQPEPARKRAPARKFTPTRGQRSLIEAALASGLKPRAVAKSLKMPLGLVEAVMKDNRP
jgi:hypothetical protein